MLDTPPSARKRPKCRSCGTQMAGHRRVSGRYVCPEDDVSDGSTKTVTPPPKLAPPPRFHPPEQRMRQTPPPSTRSKQSAHQSPRSKGPRRERIVSPAPTTMSEEHYKTEDESFDTENDFAGSPAPPKQRTSKIRPPSPARNIGQRLGAPLASIFTAAKSDIEEVQQEAGRHGLYTGTVYKPRKIQEEESQRWMVMGRDPEAVDQLVDCKRKDVARQLDLETRTTTPVPVAGAAAPPINVICKGPSFRRAFFSYIPAGFVVAVIFFSMLVYL